MLDFVNTREIDGKVYTAYRDSETPTHTVIECEGIQVEAKLKDVWNDSNKLKELFN